jgi:hypothetical protein
MNGIDEKCSNLDGDEDGRIGFPISSLMAFLELPHCPLSSCIFGYW